MCFAASVSFSVGSALVVIGLASVAIAFNRNNKWMAMAIMPLVFALQQYIEGLVWLQLNADNPDSAHFYSYFYLFFAYTFWPAYVPFCIYFIESIARRRRILKIFIFTGVLTSVAIYLPILAGWVTFSTVIQQHCIHYLIHVSNLTIIAFTLLYGTSVIVPFFICSIKKIHYYGVISLVSLMVAYGWKAYAFTSVWCFCAAILSSYLLWMLYKLPKKRAAH